MHKHIAGGRGLPVCQEICVVYLVEVTHKNFRFLAFLKTKTNQKNKTKPQRGGIILRSIKGGPKQGIQWPGMLHPS